MLSFNSTFTPLERAVLDAILEIHPSDKSALECQLASAIVTNRENTGAGFYTEFNARHETSVALSGERMRSGPTATVQGLEHGMGFILWLTDGFADCLEGYSYDESTAEMSLENTVFEISTAQHEE
jgi:hypothetical protein